MRTYYRKACLILLMSSFLLGACSTFSSGPSVPIIPGLAQTLAAQTLTVLDVKYSRYTTPEPRQSSQSQLKVFEDLSTATPAPGDTLDPGESDSAPDLNGKKVQPTPRCTNMAEFVRDISVPDYTNMDPNQRFVKTWEFKNVGTCTWNAEYSIVFMWGEAMECPNRVPIGATVAPGETVKISVPLIAPEYPNDYQGNWLFEDLTGNRFGTGYKGRQFFWVAISVGGRGYGSGLCVGGG